MPGEITAILSAICYSLSYLLLRKGQAETDTPDNGLFPVLLISSVVLVLALIVHNVVYGTPELPETNGVWAMIYCVGTGAVGTVCGRLALYKAIHYLGATRGVVLKTLSPLITMLFALVILHEHLKDFEVVGIFLLFAGIGFMLTERVWIPTRSAIGAHFQTGVLLGVSAAVLQGIGHGFRKASLLLGLNPLFAAATEALSAITLYVLYLAAVGRLRHDLTHYVRAKNLYFIAAGFVSAAGVMLFFIALSTVSVSTVSVIIGTEPILVALLSTLFFRNIEHLTWVVGISSLLVACGIVFMNFA